MSAPRNGKSGVRPKKILAVDIGGTNVKVLATGSNDVRRSPSGKELTPARMVETVRRLAAHWQYDAVSLGFPGLTGPHGPVSEPGNLAGGWVGFDFAAGFERPVKIAALIAEKAIVPVELSHLPWKGRKATLGEMLCRRGLDRLGKRKWRRIVTTIAADLMKAFLVDYVVVGGGNARELDQLPHGVRLGHNLTAFRGGFRLWGVEDVPVLTSEEPGPVPEPPQPSEWRLL